MNAPEFNQAVSVMLDASVIDALANVRPIGVQVHVPRRIWAARLFASSSHGDATVAQNDLRTALYPAGDAHPPVP